MPFSKTPKSEDKKRELESLRLRLEGACAASSDYKECVVVTGKGPAPSGLMVVGEAPGREETKLRTPFVGKAGSFFVSVMKEVFGLERDAYYITNVVKFWPTIETKRLKTRPPTKAEIGFFTPFLMEEIRIVEPKVIIAVGKTAFGTLVPEVVFRQGAWTAGPEGRSVVPVFHPAYILRRQSRLDESTAELKKVLMEAGERLKG